MKRRTPKKKHKITLKKQSSRTSFIRPRSLFLFFFLLLLFLGAYYLSTSNKATVFLTNLRGTQKAQKKEKSQENLIVDIKKTTGNSPSPAIEKVAKAKHKNPLSNSIPVLTFDEAYPDGPLKEKTRINRLVLKKHEHKLYAYEKNKLVRIYLVALGPDIKGHRQAVGDGKTPEGIYAIHQKNANSPYYKEMRLSFPNAADILYAQENKIEIPSAVFIHGLPKGLEHIGEVHRVSDWTNGSIALSNEEIDELFNYLALGSPIEIEP